MEERTTANSTDLEYRYYQYLRAQSYITEAALMDVLRSYLPHFTNYHRVLDIGCGHGEFLQLLEEAGHEAVGIDIDPAMVKTCVDNGLTAVEGDANAWLATQAGQFDAIFSTNVIEHMAAEEVQTLVRHAFHALKPGGLLLMGTPNPESLIVQFHEFWRDPTHVRLYHRQLIEFFFTDAGFVAVNNGDNAAAAWDGVDQMTDPALNPPPDLSGMAAAQAALHFDVSLSELHPLPQPPGADASLRQRLAFRVLHFFYQKFFEPYVALLRHDLAEQRRHSLLLAQHVQRVHESNLDLQRWVETLSRQQEGRFEQMGYGFRFLYPAREFYVYGNKPQSTTSSIDTTSGTELQGDVDVTTTTQV